MCQHEKSLKKRWNGADKISTHTTQMKLFMTVWKMYKDVLPSQQIKNYVSSIYKTLSTAIVATNFFVTKKSVCCYEMH